MQRHLTIVAILFVLTFHSKSFFAQCVANAGNDTTVCVTLGVNNVYLGGNPTVTGGTPPYTYSWTCNYGWPGFLYFSSSDFLDDPTAANPQLIDHNSDSLAFYLTVTDGLGNTCADSVTVRICGHFVWTMDVKFSNIIQGDSTMLSPSIGGGCYPISIEWFPNYNISDPHSNNPTVWPDTTTMYYSLATDAAGCQAQGGTFDVFVSPLSTATHDRHIMAVNIYPNPLTAKSTIETIHSDVQVLFYDLFGRTVFETRTSSSTEILRSDFNTAGIYFYAVFVDKRYVGQEKLVVK